MLQKLPDIVIEREIQRALNKTDYFRAFKMQADSYDIGSFAVLRLSGFRAERTIAGLCIIADIPDFIRQSLDGLKVEAHASGLDRLSSLSRPQILKREDFTLASIMLGERVILVPVTAESGEKFLLILGDQKSQREEGDIASMIFDFANTLRRFTVIEGLDSDLPKFRKREIEVIEWTAEGKTSADIAIILGLSEYTVNEYVASAMKKLDAVNRIHLVTKAIRLGIIS